MPSVCNNNCNKSISFGVKIHADSSKEIMSEFDKKYPEANIQSIQILEDMIDDTDRLSDLQGESTVVKIEKPKIVSRGQDVNLIFKNKYFPCEGYSKIHFKQDDYKETENFYSDLNFYRIFLKKFDDKDIAAGEKDIMLRSSVKLDCAVKDLLVTNQKRMTYDEFMHWVKVAKEIEPVEYEERQKILEEMNLKNDHRKLHSELKAKLGLR